MPNSSPHWRKNNGNVRVSADCTSAVPSGHADRQLRKRDLPFPALGTRAPRRSFDSFPMETARSDAEKRLEMDASRPCGASSLRARALLRQRIPDPGEPRPQPCFSDDSAVCRAEPQGDAGKTAGVFCASVDARHSAHPRTASRRKTARRAPGELELERRPDSRHNPVCAALPGTQVQRKPQTPDSASRDPGSALRRALLRMRLTGGRSGAARRGVRRPADALDGDKTQNSALSSACASARRSRSSLHGGFRIPGDFPAQRDTPGHLGIHSCADRRSSARRRRGIVRTPIRSVQNGGVFSAQTHGMADHSPAQ